MRFHAVFVRNLFIVLGMTLLAPGEGEAQGVDFRVRFTGQVDCDQPFRLKDIPVTANVTGTLNGDGSLVGEVTQTAYIFSSTVRFDGRLGSRLAPAPGGTSQFRVSGRSGLRLMWNLPNNTMTVNIAVSGQTCSATYDSRLNPGKRQHMLYDGNQYAYCDKPRMVMSSCEVR